MNVIVTSSTPTAIAATRTTVTIPIVVVGGATPVEAGLVQSLARPGGNEQLQLLKQVVPNISRVAVF